MAKIKKSNQSVKRCNRCAFKTTDELDMHLHILENRNGCDSTFYRDDKYKIGN